MPTQPMPSQRTTIRDVARQAGVSIATVSKVINNRYGVAPETYERVQSVISDLGYESSIVARSLRNQRTHVLGILVADLEPFSTELLKGASRAVRGTGYELVVYSPVGLHGEPVGWERRSLSRLAGTLIDGAVLVTPTVVEIPGGVPVVAVDPHTGPSDLPTVDSDNLNGARLATEHLLELGHRKIGFLGGRPDLESARLREQGYRQAMAAAGVHVDSSWVQIGSYQQELAEGAVRALFASHDRPTAVFAANDRMAIETMDVARSLGIRVPEELSVVGFDNVPESTMTEPALTTVNQPIKEMGRRAVELLLTLLEGGSLEHTHVTLPTDLVRRGSAVATQRNGSAVGG